jgi:type IV pilus assembly protein PilW
MKTIKLQAGISLVEIMIALLIGLFLMGGLIQLFISSKQTYKMQDTIGRLQENQRFAMDFLVHDMRGLGGWGCFREGASVQSRLNSTGVFTQPTTSISGENNNTSTSDSILDGTDTITLRSTSALQTTDGKDVALTTALSNLTQDLAVTANSGISVGDILFIGDCEDGNLFQATTGTAGTTVKHAALAATATLPGNSSDSLTKPYDMNARLYRFNTITYTIRTGEGGQPSLFQQVGNGTANELIEGVEDMQILYGEDTDADGTPNRYVPAGTLNLNMDNVESVRVSLLMRSLDDNQTTAPIPFTFNGAVVTASQTDKRIRRSVTSVISIRNRLL